MQMSHSLDVDDLRLAPKSPDMTTTCCRCCQKVRWATSGVHSHTPPRENPGSEVVLRLIIFKKSYIKKQENKTIGIEG